jgi:iron-sulfur cluster repair protein YtfE (RIC family)
MKRSDALAILSRDHHHALVVAQALRRADPDTAAAARARFLDFWETEGRRHFQQEEEHLLPAFAAHGDPRHPLVLQVLGDHVAIRARAARLATVSGTPPPSANPGTPPTDLQDLHELGQALADHVRLEERQLFPLIEQAMPADELLTLARRLGGLM